MIRMNTEIAVRKCNEGETNIKMRGGTAVVA